MVGRATELATLLDAFDAGRRGVPRSALIRGEAGIGKTRLVEAFLAEAARRRDDDLPQIVAIGQCVDLGPIGAPFGPIRRVLRDLHAAVGSEALRDAAGSPAAVATLGAFIPGLVDESSPPDEAASGFGETIEILLERLTETHHVVIVIEDLQWADAATLALINTLVSALRGRHLTMVLTYRTDDIDRAHPLRPVIAELDRTRAVVHLELAPLTPAEVSEQVAQLSGDPIVLSDAESLTERTGGVPFFVEELVDLGDAELPDTLRELLLARYSHLDDTARQVLRAMAAGGVRTDHDALAAAAGVDADELDAALRAAIDARAIVADGAGYAFRHALTQEAVHDEMLPRERALLHRRYAEHLENHNAGSPEGVSAVAEHWLAARDLPRAFDATVRALAQSRATFAPATSVKLTERLTDLWPNVPDAADRSGMTLAQLHLDAASGWQDLHDTSHALRATEAGLTVADDEPLVRAALLRQKFVHQSNAQGRADPELLHEARRLLDGIDTAPARVLHSRILTNLALEPDEEGPAAAAHLDRAITLAEEAGDDAALAVALVIESWRIIDTTRDDAGALAPLERAWSLQLNPAVRAYVGRAYLEGLSRVGRFADAAQVADGMADEAERVGLGRFNAGVAAGSAAHALFSLGRSAEALRHAQRARRLLPGDAHAEMVRMIGTHYSWNDQPGERDALVREEEAGRDARADDHVPREDWWDGESVDAILEAAVGGSPKMAGDQWPGRVGALEQVVVKRSLSAQRYGAVAGALMIRAVAARPAGAEPALDTGTLRERIASRVAQWPDTGVGATITAFIAATLADADGAALPERIVNWRTVLDAIEHGVMPVRHRQLARLSLAAAQVEAGDRDAAATVLDTIAAEAPGQGLASIARWADDLAKRAGLARPTASAPTAALAALTSRERQVLELLAEGLTNTQIGERLFISPKTVSVHVSAILAKTGAANRAGAAALFAADVAESG
ncbi:helix-turn-helix transcriptional regulator [Microbacterium thalassium]|nr:helix-turn-helix transcriptional regulator [Microbacterium thalassium]